MTKKRANIHPGLIGRLFTDGKSYFELVRCDAEPLATFNDITKPEQGIVTKPISEFANLVLMKPVQPRERKPKVELGALHSRLSREALVLVPELQKMEEGLNSDNLSIHVPTGIGDDKEYKVNIAGSKAHGPAERRNK